MASPRTFASTAGGRTPRSDSGAAGGGGGGGFLTPVDTIARASASRLVDVPTGALPDGTLVFVRSVRDFFVLDKNSAAVADDITVAAALDGGRWGRRFEPDVEWLTQADWTIDPGAADDEGAGTAGDPLRSHAELGRRAFKHGWVIRQSTVVNITDAGLPASDPIEVDIALADSSVLVRYVGAPTAQQAGTFTDATALVSGTALPTVEDTTLGLGGGNLGQRIRLTSGASAGAIAWALRDDGADVLTTSAFATTSKTPPASGNTTLKNPTGGGGDDYVLETLPLVRLGRIKLTNQVGTDVPLLFDSLLVGEPGEGAVNLVTNLDRAFFVDCMIDNVSFRKADAVFASCLFVELSDLAGNGELAAGAIFDAARMRGEGAVVRIGAEHTAVGTPLVAMGFAQYLCTGPISAHDASGAGISLGPFTALQTSSLIWGTGNGTFGIDAAGGKLFYASGTKPTVTGATNDTQVGGVGTAYAAVPAFNGGNGSAIVENP